MSKTTTQIEQALEAWETKYKPIKNHIDTDSSWDGMMFETYDEQRDFVYSQSDKNVWTWVDGDKGTWIVSGCAHVNRIGYFITEKPCELDYMEIQVDIYGDNK